MRILMLPRYGRKGANSRYRLWQYLPLFESAGYRVDVKPMLDDGYLDALYRRGVRPARSLLAGYLRQFPRLLAARRYDAVLLDQELLPYLPPVFEQLLCALNPRVVVDYDDAAYLKYQRLRPLRGRIGKIMGAARAVVVGNRHLERYAGRFSGDVRLIPTVVDVAKYAPRNHADGSGTIRVCWIGTPVTASQYLPAILPTLRQLQEEFPELTFRFIGAGELAASEGLRLESVAWSEDSEVQALTECDIGIMPLPDGEFQRGKCGLKLIQYMAAGLPVVASPVGENSHIVDHGENGFIAVTARDWVQSLRVLLRERELRARMGRSGRLKVESRYSLSYGFQQWCQLMRDIAEQPLAPLEHRFSLSQ